MTMLPPSMAGPAVVPLKTFPYMVGPYSNIVPWTHRDGISFIAKFDGLVNWVLDELSPYINAEITRLIEQYNAASLELKAAMDKYKEDIAADHAEFERVVQAAEALIREVSAHVDEAVLEAKASADEAERWNAATEALQDDAVSSLLARPETAAHKTAMSALFADSPFGTVVPLDLTYEAVQAAATSAAQRGKRIQAVGTIRTDKTLVLTCSGDMSGLQIEYTGNAVSVQVGLEGELTSRQSLLLPKTANVNKTEKGWAQVLGSTGVRIVNLNAWPSIVVPHIQHFDIGLHLTGRGRGTVHNTIMLGHLDNNRWNMYLDADAAGWCNQNLFLNGRFSHNSLEGLEVAGVKHVHIQKGLVSAVNGNVWMNPSVEYGTPEFHFDFAGIHNDVYNARWEVAGGARIRWQDASNRNTIIGGYAAHQIRQTFETGVVGCNIESGTRKTYAMSNAGPIAVYENQSSSAAPTRVVLPAGTTAAAGDPALSWTVRESSQATSYRRAGDLFDRARIDHVNGRVYLGNGTADPLAYIGSLGAAAMAVSADLGFLPTNTRDLGVAGALPRHIRAGTSFVFPAYTTAARPPLQDLETGATIFDRTLNKLVTVNAARNAWVDGAGVAV